MQEYNKPGRNDPCPCGSGKKFKKCCLGKEKFQNQIDSFLPPEVTKQFQEHKIREVEREKSFGKIKPDIGIEFKGKKHIAVGNRIYFSEKWKYFPDFLFEYLSVTFGEKWRKTELSKSFEKQHQLMQWWKKGAEFSKKHDGTHGIIPNGFLAAFLTFAYDLYVIESNSVLDNDLLNRLKQHSQFQGARHELFAEATCLRAGYSIEHEDEKDRSKRHAEFTAIHKSSKQKISVEAKSKHRAGILGFTGKPQPENELNLRFGGLINDAIGKNPPNPLVIFLDTNLPVSIAESLFSPESEDPFVPPKVFMRLLNSIQKKHKGKDPHNLIVFTNHPHHFAEENETDPKKHLLSIISQKPDKPVTNLKAIVDLHEAANKYGNIPKELPQ